MIVTCFSFTFHLKFIIIFSVVAFFKNCILYESVYSTQQNVSVDQMRPTFFFEFR